MPRRLEAQACTATIGRNENDSTVEEIAAPSPEIEIVRASARILVDLTGPKDGPGRAWHYKLCAAQTICARASNVGTRALWAADGAALDQWLLDHAGAQPRGKDWPASRLNVYALMRRVAPEIGSQIIATYARKIAQKWYQTRWDALVKFACSPPHYVEASMPLYVREQAYRLRFDGENYTLSLSITPGRHAGGHEISLPLSPRDARQESILNSLVSGTVVGGEVILEPHPRRPYQWVVRISYKRKVERRTAGKVAALNRGLRSFLVVVDEDGAVWRYDAQDIEAWLHQIQARRKSYQYASKASGRDGHGRRHMLTAIEKLQAAGERWRRTKCQTIARRVARWLAKGDVSTLYIEDFSGIRHADERKLEVGDPIKREAIWRRIQEWPYYRLQQCIVACCEEEGMTVKAQEPRAISIRCPKCGVVGYGLRDLSTWRISCACGVQYDLDEGAALNVMIRGCEADDLPAPTLAIGRIAHEHGRHKRRVETY